jgi:hypothetical protein
MNHITSQRPHRVCCFVRVSCGMCGLQASLQDMQPDAKLQSLRKMAANAAATAVGLGSRQAECLTSV